MAKRRYRSMSDRERKAMFARLYGVNNSRAQVTNIHSNSDSFARSDKSNFHNLHFIKQKNIPTGTKLNKGFKIPKTEIEKPPQNNIESKISEKVKTYKEQKPSTTSKIIDVFKKIPPDKFAGAVATTASLATGNPLPLMVYQSYKAAKIADDIHNRMENIKLREGLKELTKLYAEGIGQKVLEKRTDEISNKVTNQLQEAGTIRLITQSTYYNENSVKMLLQNTVSDTIDSGIGNLTSWTVDAVL